MSPLRIGDPTLTGPASLTRERRSRSFGRARRRAFPRATRKMTGNDKYKSTGTVESGGGDGQSARSAPTCNYFHGRPRNTPGPPAVTPQVIEAKNLRNVVEARESRRRNGQAGDLAVPAHPLHHDRR